MKYYQICGFNSHILRWFNFDIQLLSNDIFSTLCTKKDGADYIELVLGVLRSGASYLLVTEHQMGQIVANAGRKIPRKGLERPLLAAQYVSLSPITFQSPAELHSKMKTYVLKKTKPGKAPLKDTSQANKMFEREYLARSSFEHQRILWKAIQGTIDFDKFSLPPMYWLASTSLVALAFQSWEFDSYQRLRTNPKVLDLGLSSISCMGFRENYDKRIKRSVHFKIAEHATLGNKGVGHAEFKYGQTETITRDALGKRLNEFFASIESERVFLLVYDAEQTLNALKATNVQTEAYELGIQKLLCREDDEDVKDYKTKPTRFNRYDDQWPARDWQSVAKQDISISRRRSRSPDRSPKMRPKSPPPRLSDAYEEREEGEKLEDEDDEEVERKTEIYVIDVGAHFLAHSRLGPQNLKNLVDMAERLGIPVNKSARCSGNDCRLLIEAWKRMASGNAIDEQYRDVWAMHEAAYNARREERDVADRDGPSSDQAQAENYDPNDVIVPQNASGQGRFAVVPGTLGPPMDDSDDEDVYDY